MSFKGSSIKRYGFWVTLGGGSKVSIKGKDFRSLGKNLKEIVKPLFGGLNSNGFHRLMCLNA